MKPCNRMGIALALLLTMVGGVASADSRVPVPHPGPALGDRCVEDTNFMRRNHMKLLLHQRDETMHRGIRTKKYSLKHCLTCHAPKKPAAEQTGQPHFCQSCHAYAGVRIDCFECHARYAQPK